MKGYHVIRTRYKNYPGYKVYLDCFYVNSFETEESAKHYIQYIDAHCSVPCWPYLEVIQLENFKEDMSSYKIQFGKFEGKSFDEMPINYLLWLYFYEKRMKYNNYLKTEILNRSKELRDKNLNSYGMSYVVV